MARTLLYLLLPLAYLAFWTIFLFSNYDTYSSSDPEMLSRDYLFLFVGQRQQLLFAEMIFPLSMAFFFLLIMVLRLRMKSMRIPLLIAQFLSLEFFIYRQFFFSDSYASYQAASQMELPLEYAEQNSYLVFIVAMGLGFLLTLVVRDHRGKSSFLRKI